MKTHRKPSISLATNRVCGVLGFTLTFAAAQFAHASSAWTGAVNNSWLESGNWTSGVPGASTEAVFVNTGSSSVLANTPDDNVSVGALRFTSDLAGPFSLSVPATSRTMSLQAGNSITVEAGAPAVTISMGPSGTIQFPGSAANSYITNNSSNTLTINARFQRSGSGSPNIRFTGTGNTEVTNDILGTAGRLWLEPTFSGMLTIASGGGRLMIGQETTVNGGTLAIDGTANSDATNFTINAGILTGGGRIGTGSASGSTVAINMNNGSTVNPGRVGETGTLTFENNNVNFNAGATLAFDLLNASTHDQLLFEKTFEHANYVVPTVNLSGSGDGVTLSLNLLPGFSAQANDQFVLLSGYENIVGTFADLGDGDLIDIGGYSFQINYGAGATTLTVIPEPATSALLFGLGILLMVRLRRARS